MTRRVLLFVFSLALLVVALPTGAWAGDILSGASCEANPSIVISGLTPTMQPASFCNTQGFPKCDTFDGTACGPLNPPQQRCVAPAGVCEWGVCNCYDGSYHCIW
jgi:hypothetical protein